MILIVPELEVKHFDKIKIGIPRDWKQFTPDGIKPEGGKQIAFLEAEPGNSNENELEKIVITADIHAEDMTIEDYWGAYLANVTQQSSFSAIGDPVSTSVGDFPGFQFAYYCNIGDHPCRQEALSWLDRNNETAYCVGFIAGIKNYELKKPIFDAVWDSIEYSPSDPTLSPLDRTNTGTKSHNMEGNSKDIGPGSKKGGRLPL